METCPQCNGDKTVYTAIDDLTKDPPVKTGVDLTCPTCQGDGEIPVEQKAAYEARQELWCRCGDKETFGSYPEDGKCDCGVHKHHVHCGTCGKISQIG